jgi:hypothetical protein
MEDDNDVTLDCLGVGASHQVHSVEQPSAWIPRPARMLRSQAGDPTSSVATQSRKSRCKCLMRNGLPMSMAVANIRTVRVLLSFVY